MHARPRSSQWPLLLAAVALLTAAFGGPALTQSTNAGRGITLIDGREAAAGEVLMKARSSARAQRGRLAVTAGADRMDALGRSGVDRVRSSKLSTAELLRSLRSDPDVEYAEPNWVIRASVLPNDPSLGALWGLFNTGANSYGGAGLAGADIDAPAAWNITTGARNAVVGVIDTGINYSHPDLAANVWSAPSAFTVTIAGQPITCAAGTHGFNAITRTCDPMDDAATPHGTHVAGTIGAVGNNGVGVAGVNWVASMMGLKFLDANGSGYTSNAVYAIEFAIQAKAAFAASAGANVRVLSNSWGGGGYSQTLADEIAAANTAGMLFVVAAGNSRANNDVSPSYPASYPVANIISAAATDNRDALASFSNYGATSVHLAAPGVSVWSTGAASNYLGLSGTSMATPHVSGAAALLLAVCPSATTAQLRSYLLSSVDLVPALSTVTSTGGRLNVARALQACSTPVVSNIAVSVDKVAPQAPGTAMTFTATATGGQAPYTWRWYLWDGVTWTGLTAYSSSNTLTWTPAVANLNYQVQARVRSAWNTGTYEALGMVSYPIRPMVSTVVVASTLAAPQPPGTAVTFTATASGGQAPYQYRWAVFDGATWVTVTNWATGNSFTWTPATTNLAYRVQARARSNWNSGSMEAAGTVDFPVAPRVTSVAMSIDKTAPQLPNTTITFTATANGGLAPVQYGWFLWNGSTWSTLANYSTSNRYVWTPTTGNTRYQVQARARSAGNVATVESVGTVTFPIQPVVSSVTVVASKTAPQLRGTSIGFTATATGGTAPYQYRWAVFDGVTWTAVTAWTTSRTLAWAPATPNAAYRVQARVRSAGNSGNMEAAGTIDFPIQ